MLFHSIAGIGVPLHLSLNIEKYSPLSPYEYEKYHNI